MGREAQKQAGKPGDHRVTLAGWKRAREHQAQDLSTHLAHGTVGNWKHQS